MLEIALLVAATTPDQVLYSYGPLGVGVVVFALACAKMFSILLKDRDKAMTDRDALLEDVFTKVLPAVARNTEVLEKVIEVMAESSTSVRENGEVLKDIRRALMYSRPEGGT